MRYLAAFGRFWYDFLVGDRPELFVGPLVGLALAWLVLQSNAGSLAAGLALVLAVVAVGTISLGLTTRGRK